jgi:pyruvate kinase
MFRKTKIICTLGPAVDSPDMIRALIRGGMNAARFNFSHGSHPEHLARLNMLKMVRDTMSRPVATILDTKGPEIRIKSFAEKTVDIVKTKNASGGITDIVIGTMAYSEDYSGTCGMFAGDCVYIKSIEFIA